MRLVPYILIIILAIFAGAACADTSIGTVQVPETWTINNFWTDTGLDLVVGDIIHVTAAGSWNAGMPGDYYGADGYDKLWYDHWMNPNSLADGRVDPNAGGAAPVLEHFGALVGYLGDTPPAPGSYAIADYPTKVDYASHVILLGSDVLVTIPIAGRLWLGINDDAYSGNYFDNLGSLATTVEVLPEPSALLALAVGLAGVGGAALRRWR